MAEDRDILRLSMSEIINAGKGDCWCQESNILIVQYDVIDVGQVKSCDSLIKGVVQDYNQCLDFME